MEHRSTTAPSNPTAAPTALPTFRVLVTDGIDQDGIDLLKAESRLQVEVSPTLPPAELIARIAEFDAVIVRSATKVNEEVIKKGTKLKAIGRAGVGIDNIALKAATTHGIAVINSPAGNTIAVAELFFASVLGLFRHLPAADATMKAGKWDRNKLVGRELFGRTLGIVGVGPIGGEVAARARAFGMKVMAYDPYVSDARLQALQVSRAASLEALLAVSDVLTVHTPLTDETRGLIGKKAFALLPPDAVVVNLARGGIIDQEALIEALTSGKLGGAVLDVYDVEPLPPEHPLRKAPRVVLTPHLGASTVEAQRNVAVDACAAVRDALLHKEFGRSINVASLDGLGWSEIQPALQLTQRMAAVARARLADKGIKLVGRLSVRVGQEFTGGREAFLSAAALGALDGVVESEQLNLINARAMANARGLEVAVGDVVGMDNPAAIEVTVGSGLDSVTVSGMAPPRTSARITWIEGFRVDIVPRQTLIILTNNDVPGVIGRVGTLLGAAGVNIAEYHQARLRPGGEAMAAVSVDDPVGQDVRRKLLELPDIRSATIVSFQTA
ncbi:MAG TPA: phosphoglycerate dehydrogenase [Gemmatimonadales bacterium]|nr:phosphoglycerate dehydrogenase [Gemmatimonadales bacterium]